MGCIHPLEVAGVIVAPVPTTLSSCQQLRFIYIFLFSVCSGALSAGSNGRLDCSISILVRWIVALFYFFVVNPKL